jgi:nuclear pore complex protein Nup88
VTAWSGGQLQIDALADEIQPVWNVGSPPRLRVDSNDHVLGVAMICESIEGELPVVKLDQPLDHTIWLGHAPPLLRLAIVDLALPRETDSGSLIMLFADPLMPERLFSLHEGGIDSIVLHFLPFTSQTSGKDETMRTPSVHPVLSTCQGENPVQSPLCGFVSLSDSFGYSWIVGVTVCRECVVLEMKTWNLLLPIHIDMEKSSSSQEQKGRDIPDVISKELLHGPKAILLPQASPNLRSVAADSIEGRQTLHQYFKLFHENYVEYAHKVRTYQPVNIQLPLFSLTDLYIYDRNFFFFFSFFLKKKFNRGRGDLNPGCLLWRTPKSANQLSYKALGTFTIGTHQNIWSLLILGHN